MSRDLSLLLSGPHEFGRGSPDPESHDHNLGVSTAPPAPASALASRSAPTLSGLSLALILTASFMVVLDFSIVNVALPSVQHELGFSLSAVQWVVTAYAIAFGGLLILGGRAADLFGRRRMFTTGLLIFTVASLSGGLAHDQTLLVASRAVQGLGGALVAPSALSLITTGFPAGPQRTRALGMYGATASIGFVSGQVLGGVLVEFTSWRSVFLVNVPVGIAAAVLGSRLLPRAASDGAARRRMDVGGAALITIAVAALVYAVSQVNVLGWTDDRVLGALAVSIAAGVALLAVERRHPDPLVRIDLLREPGLRKASTIIMLLGLWNGGEMIVLSLYFQQVLHQSPLVTGLAIAPQGAIGFTAGTFGPRLARRIGVHRVLMITTVTAASGFLILSRLPSSGGYSPLFLAVMLVGFGTAGTGFGATVTASQNAADTEQGVVGGVLNTSRQVGAALGAALLPAISEAVERGGRVGGATGDRDAMLTACAAAAVAAAVAWRSRKPATATRGRQPNPAESR
jgi:EmrB/QacA subfamily drug resistance transporter